MHLCTCFLLCRLRSSSSPFRSFGTSSFDSPPYCPVRHSYPSSHIPSSFSHYAHPLSILVVIIMLYSPCSSTTLIPFFPYCQCFSAFVYVFYFLFPCIHFVIQGGRKYKDFRLYNPVYVFPCNFLSLMFTANLFSGALSSARRPHSLQPTLNKKVSPSRLVSGCSSESAIGDSY